MPSHESGDNQKVVIRVVLVTVGAGGIGITHHVADLKDS